MYRAAGHLAHVRHIDPVLAATLIDAETLADEALRGRDAGERASQVAAIPEVRAALFTYQQDFANQPSGAVLDGRDIGTVIAPPRHGQALRDRRTRSARPHRRWLQLVKLNPDLSEAEVLSDIRIRDERDSSRSSAPLEKATDALLLDTSDLGIEAAIATARSLVKSRL